MAWTTAWPAHTFRLGRVCDAQFGQPTSDCATRNAGGAHDRADPATPLAVTPPPLRDAAAPRAVQHRSKRLKVPESDQNDVVLRRLGESQRETKSSAIKALSLGVAPTTVGVCRDIATRSRLRNTSIETPLL